MRRTLVGSLVCVAAASVVVGPPALAAGNRCHRPPDAIVMKTSHSSVVYALADTSDVFNSQTRFWGCLKSRGELVRLLGNSDKDLGDQTVNSRFRLQGRFVAFVRTQTYKSVGSLALLVYDLGNGRQVHRLGAGVAAPPPSGESISHLVLSARGYIAWLQVGPAPFGSSTGAQPQASITVLDGRGQRVLDHGAASAIQRLRRAAGKGVTWLRGDETRSYVFKNA
jgi:hypothetical protein